MKTVLASIGAALLAGGATLPAHGAFAHDGSFGAASGVASAGPALIQLARYGFYGRGLRYGRFGRGYHGFYGGFPYYGCGSYYYGRYRRC